MWFHFFLSSRQEMFDYTILFLYWIRLPEPNSIKLISNRTMSLGADVNTIRLNAYSTDINIKLHSFRTLLFWHVQRLAPIVRQWNFYYGKNGFGLYFLKVYFIFINPYFFKTCLTVRTIIRSVQASVQFVFIQHRKKKIIDFFFNRKEAEHCS